MILDRRALWLGLAFCLPGLAMITLLMLQIEPPFARALDNQGVGPNVLGTAIALTLIVLLPALAFALNLLALRRARRSGGRRVHPAHIALAVAALLVVGTFAGAVIVDQYPCWVGVPNCD